MAKLQGQRGPADKPHVAEFRQREKTAGESQGGGSQGFDVEHRKDSFGTWPTVDRNERAVGSSVRNRCAASTIAFSP